MSTLRSIADQLARVSALLDETHHGARALGRLRLELMRDLARAGWTNTAIANAAGISRPRVTQLLEGRE